MVQIVSPVMFSEECADHMKLPMPPDAVMLAKAAYYSEDKAGTDIAEITHCQLRLLPKSRKNN